MSLAEILITNSLSAKKERFEPTEPGLAKIYFCGPTVYGFGHVGNARAALTADLIVRILRHAGYKTLFARNLTDIDDKIIRVANEEGVSAQSVAEKFTKVYLGEMQQLGTLEPDLIPKATEHIPSVLKMNEGLIHKGLAYVADTPFGNDVYYRVSAFKNYGALSKRKTDDMLTGTRIEAGESKESPLDFALWKAAKAGEPSWESPWGAGRPGWHIECSAMIREHFKGTIDIHGGGNDLVFPHHENEIAQSEGLDNCQLAKYWVHNGMLTIGREKMSKSLGNIFTTHKFLEEYGPETLRMLILQHQYRGPIDFTDETILRSEALLQRLYACKQHALEAAQAAPEATLPPDLAQLTAQMNAAFFDDFNSAKALGHALKAARLCFREQKPGYWKAWGACLPLLENVLALLNRAPDQALAQMHALRLKRLGVSEEFSRQIDQQLKDREHFRQEKNYAESDRIRGELEKAGIVVMDGADGASWTLNAEATKVT